MIAHLTIRARLAVALAIAALPLSLAPLVAACAESNASGPPDDDNSLRAPVDAGDAATPADAADAADSALPDVPCAVGNVCRVSSPLTLGSISALSGRSRSDVWAAGSLGLTMRWDGHAWTELTSTEVPKSLVTFSSIFLTSEEAWAVAGAQVLRRGTDPASIRSFELFDGERAPATIAVLGSGDVYVGCVVGGLAPPGATGALLKITSFEDGAVELVPHPTLPGDDRPQPMSIRASFLVPGKALWAVGDRAAVARYPVEPFGPGVVLPLTIQKNLLAAWGTGDHLWAAGESGTIVHFDGSEWHDEASGTSATLDAIFGFSASDIWAAGDSGTLLHFDGKSWSPVVIQGYSGALRAIWGAATNDVWFGGEDGLFHWGALP